MHLFYLESELILCNTARTVSTIEPRLLPKNLPAGPESHVYHGHHIELLCSVLECSIGPVNQEKFEDKTRTGGKLWVDICTFAHFSAPKLSELLP